MKKIILTALVLTGITATAQVKVGDNATAPMSSGALLEMESTNKGLLISRMTTAQRTAIASPANGLQVYDTDTKSFWYFDGTEWVEKTSAKNGVWVRENDSIAHLNLANSNDSIKYTKSGYKSFDKNDVNYGIYNYTLNNGTFINQTKDSVYSYNLSKILSSNHTDYSPNTTGSINFNGNLVLVDNADTGKVGRNLFNIWHNIRTATDNANNYGTLYGITGGPTHAGTGKVNTLIGVYANTILDPQAEASTMRGTMGQVTNYSTKPLTTMTGAYNYASIRGTGTISNVQGAYNIVNTSGTTSSVVNSIFGSDNNVTTGSGWSGSATDVFGVRANVSINASGGATATNVYGLYSRAVATSATNLYGLYITDVTTAANRWSIYTAGGAHRFGGNTTINAPGSDGIIGLEVRKNDNAQYTASVYNGGVNGLGLQINAGASAGTPLSVNNSTGTTNYLTVLNSGGRVGVGTATPSDRFTVYNTTNTTSTIQSGEDGTTNTYRANLRFSDANNLTMGTIGFPSTAHNNLVVGSNNGADVELRPGGGLYGTQGSFIVKATTGFVGVNSSNPSALLHVLSKGDNTEIFKISTAANGHLIFKDIDAASLPASLSGLSTTSDNMVMEVPNSRSLIMKIRGNDGTDGIYTINSADELVMTVRENKRVGIGVLAPQAELEVNGIIKVGDNASLTPQNGMIRYNSTINKFQGYANGAWVDLH